MAARASTDHEFGRYATAPARWTSRERRRTLARGERIGADAEAALEALAIRRFDPGVASRAREAAARNSGARKLAAALEKALDG